MTTVDYRELRSRSPPLFPRRAQEAAGASEGTFHDHVAHDCK